MAEVYCLVLNDREPLPEDSLNDLASHATVVWAQDVGRERTLPDVLRANADASVLVTTYMDLSSKNLQLLPRLRGIVTTTTAVEYIDLAYCKANDIRVMNTTGYAGASVAEFAIALMFSAARDIPGIDRAVRGGDFELASFMGIELSGRTAGIIGLGNIGARIATIASGIGMRTVFFNRSQKAHQSGTQVPLDTLLRSSDVVFLSVPLNEGTRFLLNESRLSSMKSGAIIVSISPDAVVDQKALAAALQSGHVRAAGLDLHGRTAIFHSVPHAILSARRAWYTQESFQRRVASWKNTVECFLHGNPRNVIV